jgi:adenosine phosphosulfate reductase beta subunit
MPTFVYMTRCDGCGQCVDICPSDIMHIDKTLRRAYNIEPFDVLTTLNLTCAGSVTPV